MNKMGKPFNTHNWLIVSNICKETCKLKRNDKIKLIEKQAKTWQGIAKEETRSVNIYVKRRLIFLVIIKMQIITPVRSSFILNQLDKLKFLQ